MQHIEQHLSLLGTLITLGFVVLAWINTLQSKKSIRDMDKAAGEMIKSLAEDMRRVEQKCISLDGDVKVLDAQLAMLRQELVNLDVAKSFS